MNKLPIELLREIIHLSLPKFHHSRYKERYHILLGFSSISSQWKIVAQGELMKHLIIKNVKTLNLLLNRLRGLRKEGIAIHTISLYLEGETKASTVGLITILNLCDRIQELYIVKNLFPTTLFATFNWSTLTDLKALHLIDCNEPPSRTHLLRFPFLTHLTLFNITNLPLDGDDEMDSGYLHPSVFPKLHSINFGYLESTPSTPTFMIPKSLAPQILHLGIYDKSQHATNRFTNELSEYMTSLKSLMLYSFHDLISSFRISFDCFPTTVSSLSFIHSGTFSSNGMNLIPVLEWLRTFTVAQVCNLKRIELPFKTTELTLLNINGHTISIGEELCNLCSSLGIILDCSHFPESDRKSLNNLEIVELLNQTFSDMIL